jgi:malate dehydrogenase
VTGAAGQIAYNFIPLLCSGEVLGRDQPVILHMLDIEESKAMLAAVEMELIDGAYPLLRSIVSTTNAQEAFSNIDFAVLLGGFPRLKGMTRADLLSRNGEIFKKQGAALGQFAKPTCKVVVVANPANTNALIAYQFSQGRIPATNFTSLTRLDQNRAVGSLAAKLKVPAGSIKKVVIWGNHSQDQYPDVNQAVVIQECKEVKITEALSSEAKFLEDFIPDVQNRGTKVIEARGKSSALSAANAVKDHLFDWVNGSKWGDWASMGVVTDGSYYDIPAGLVYSVPCVCKDGQYSVVQGLSHTEDGQARLKLNIEKLQEEIDTALKTI